MRRKFTILMLCAAFLLVGGAVALYANMVNSATPVATHFFTVAPNQIQTMEQTANAGVASLLAQATLPPGATPFAVVATNVAGTQAAVSTALTCRSTAPPAAASATALALWGTVDPKNRDAGFLLTAQAQNPGAPITASKTTDLAPNIPPEEKVAVVVLHPNCTFEEFKIAPGPTVDTFIASLPKTDVLFLVVPPQSTVGKHPASAPASLGSNTPSPQQTAKP